MAGLADISFEDLLAVLDRERSTLDPGVEALTYHRWIESNGKTSPLLFAAWFNLGTVWARLGRHDDAVTAFEAALALRPGLSAASINLGLQFEILNQPVAALQAWSNALQADDVRAGLLTQKGRLLEKLGELLEAEKVLKVAAAIGPTNVDVIHHWVHLRQKLCAWPTLQPLVASLTEADLLRSSGPLGVVALTDDIGIQSAAALSWVERKTQVAPRHLAPVEGYAHQRIRIGYVSSDFCRHAMSYLIAELFERHNRDWFEVFGYCASRDDGSDIRRRILGAFDHYRVIRDLSDEQAANVIRRDEIDILIDLNGLTEGTRLPVLRWRPAPVQATYLGFIGAVPLPELDYLLCDDFVIPKDLAARYQPTPVAIPHLYQANDTKRAIGRLMSRDEVGLPADKFVFCCFSRHYKITQDMFCSWLQILQHTTHTVLWLAEDNPWSQANLHQEMVKAGISPDRLVFAARIDPDLYMSRLGLADLFLDTFPYNSGTVASDALRMGLPLLTQIGEAFASRMAGSLLNSMGAIDAITESRAAYIAKAIELATDKIAYSKFRGAFSGDAWSGSLGNAPRFAADFEATLRSIVRKPPVCCIKLDPSLVNPILPVAATEVASLVEIPFRLEQFGFDLIPSPSGRDL